MKIIDWMLGIDRGYKGFYTAKYFPTGMHLPSGSTYQLHPDEYSWCTTGTLDNGEFIPTKGRLSYYSIFANVKLSEVRTDIEGHTIFVIPGTSRAIVAPNFVELILCIENWDGTINSIVLDRRSFILDDEMVLSGSIIVRCEDSGARYSLAIRSDGLDILVSEVYFRGSKLE